jgi:uncharacterized MAPEG superfamily protein
VERDLESGVDAARIALDSGFGPRPPRNDGGRSLGGKAMTVELTYLAYTIVLFFAVVLIQATTAILNNGLVAMMNSRDNLKPPTAIQARTKRLTDNFRENLWFFVPLVLIAAIANVSNQWTLIGVHLFFWARLAHAVWYIAGWPLIRPLFWFAGVVACAMIFLALFGILS